MHMFADTAKILLEDSHGRISDVYGNEQECVRFFLVNDGSDHKIYEKVRCSLYIQKVIR